MSDITLILMAAGESTRFNGAVKKQWLRVGEKPLWQFAADRFAFEFEFDKVVVAAASGEVGLIRALCDYEAIAGGLTREASLKNALEAAASEWVLVADAARALTPIEVARRVLDAKGSADCVAPAIRSVDTLVDSDFQIVDRDKVIRVQTPQLSRVALLRSALAQKSGFSDESTLIAACGGVTRYVEGSELSAKLTYGGEIANLAPPSGEILIGQGADVHGFEENKPMKLCGVAIDSPFGLKAHSDGDAALHALIDAILGACGLGDIGDWFSDGDETYKNADSAELLRVVLDKIRRFGFVVKSADITIAAQKPRLENYKIAMKKSVAKLLDLRYERVNVKATTTEKLGFIGRGEGLAAFAIASVGYSA
ncbi:MAG: bifunctional 2-C-methyl-D-erythritol 4-phosphate cytidylyltransferase/2-C-methyl-D-erythritol 2,4-cyclodiphosphate synthase [Helicobacteraceae bacterium]|jgi:2-C-methyl-D-erythritol 4-phosphate cytidylyltransferase/2-C-methyl-D-erythritol 2,4-cyclodiphosphate synthase|nr:bifunctional 2-C-methyl-D-erythritol 4-phosphate cytidylyltransferase/2-C-methyl-D-erythritol 2,4-cyclodiphosphate synthase [Helicobacteraceae bacterium]